MKFYAAVPIALENMFAYEQEMFIRTYFFQ